MTQPKLESVAKLLVVNDKREILVLTVGEHRAKPERSFTPDLPGGLVDPGETEVIAAVRELEEETGIRLDTTQLQLIYAKTEFSSSENRSVSKFLYLTILHDTPDVTVSWEHASFDWVPLNTLLDVVELRPFYREAVEYCFANDILQRA